MRRLIGILVRDVATATSQRLEEANPQSVDALQRMPAPVIGHSAEFKEMVRELKDFLYEHMYRSYRVVRMAQKAERFITQLFSAYVQEPNMLPDTTQAKLDKVNGVPIERIVTDYVAGMTDRYALEEYQRLFDPFTKP